MLRNSSLRIVLNPIKYHRSIYNSNLASRVTNKFYQPSPYVHITHRQFCSSNNNNGEDDKKPTIEEKKEISPAENEEKNTNTIQEKPEIEKPEIEKKNKKTVKEVQEAPDLQENENKNENAKQELQEKPEKEKLKPIDRARILASQRPSTNPNILKEKEKVDPNACPKQVHAILRDRTYFPTFKYKFALTIDPKTAKNLTHFAVFRQDQAETPSYATGTLMSVVFLHQVSETKADVYAIGTRRVVRIPKKGDKDFGDAGTDWTRFSPIIDIEPVDDLSFDEENIELNAFSREMQNKILDYINGLASVSSYAVDLLQNLPISNYHQQISYWVGEKVYLYRREGQDLLETTNIVDRFKKSMHILYKEHEIAKYNKEIRNQFTDYYALVRHSRHGLQNPQIIKQNQSGQPTGNQQGGGQGIPSTRQKNIDNLEQKINERLKEITLPPEVDKIMQEDLERIRLIEPSSPEYNVTRNYILSLIKIPWGIFSKDNLDLEHSQTTLDKHHYGLKTVKERIMQFISVGIIKNSLNKAAAGKIICLVGPPGVGKTSIAKSIAESIGRKYFRFSVGGLTDTSEIKGHRRTYIGSLPGRIVKGLMQVQTLNAVFVIDEIDKMGKSWNGDPASALLEALDPEQNKEFLDNYLDVPVDLSSMLFICTANTLSTIPEPLLNRMEVIEVPGYTSAEKLEILTRYLIPKTAEESGVDASLIDISSVHKTIMEYYCREAGVRVLQQSIESLFRQAAFKLAKKEISEENKLIVTKENLRKYLGRPSYSVEKAFSVDPPPGVVLGLSYTGVGGSVLLLECVAHPLAESNTSTNDQTGKLTGNLGQVLTESAQIAEFFVKILLKAKQPENNFFSRNSISVHLPSGSVKKDGPSAGIALATALYSLASGIPVNPKLAMTGEITLTGRVLVVGGIKEKVLGAQRAGVKTLIMPFDNRFDWEELEEELKNDFDNVYFVKQYSQVYEYIFGDHSPPVNEITGDEDCI